jgi:hypothetical protein
MAETKEAGMDECPDDPVENSYTIDQLRREVRRLWDRENALLKALRSVPEVPPPMVLNWLGQAGRFPEDYHVGNRMQFKLGLDAIPPRTECEMGAGLWARIRKGLLDGREPEDDR